jgi:hypothetical protein
MGPVDTSYDPVSYYDHNERFHQWLKVKGINSNRSTIVKALDLLCQLLRRQRVG